MSNDTHLCSMALECKSKTCPHAKAHDPTTGHDVCTRSAPCGCWPDNPRFQPHVRCMPKDEVKPNPDCPKCGKAGADGHHWEDCHNHHVFLKNAEIAQLRGKVVELEAHLDHEKQKYEAPKGDVFELCFKLTRKFAPRTTLNTFISEFNKAKEVE